nr:SPOR domain-containing protein [Thiolapillus sp.]
MAAIPVEPKRDFDPALLQDAPPEKKTSEPSAAAAVPAARVEKPPAPASPPIVREKPRPKPPVAAEKKTVPKPPKKAEKKVEKKPAVPKAALTPSSWVVQVASFSSRGSADKLVKKLRKAGLDTMNPAAVTVNGKKYYRVQVGPELDKQRAQKLLPRINRISGTKGQVVRYP